MYQQLKAWTNRLYNNIHFRSYRSKPAKEVFKHIYYNNKWSGRSHSGPGSELDLSGVKCAGGDIVEEIVQNNQKYTSNKIAFRFLDLLENQLHLPMIWFCVAIVWSIFHIETLERPWTIAKVRLQLSADYNISRK